MNEKYFKVIVKVENEPEADGKKAKSTKEEYLVKGYGPSDVEAKITERFKGYSFDFSLPTVSETKILEVIE